MPAPELKWLTISVEIKLFKHHVHIVYWLLIHSF